TGSTRPRTLTTPSTRAAASGSGVIVTARTSSRTSAVGRPYLWLPSSKIRTSRVRALPGAEMGADAALRSGTTRLALGTVTYTARSPPRDGVAKSVTCNGRREGADCLTGPDYGI